MNKYLQHIISYSMFGLVLLWGSYYLADYWSQEWIIVVGRIIGIMALVMIVFTLICWYESGKNRG